MLKLRPLTYIGAVVILAAISLFGQQGIDQIAVPRSAGDPFRISTGSSFYASGTGSGKREPTRTAAPALIGDLQEAFDVIRRNYVDRSLKLQTRAAESATRTMLRSLDPHSTYWSPQEFAELLGEHHSEYSGTGSTIMNFRRNGRVETYVVAVAPGSPSERAGLRFGDRLIAVDTKDVSGLSSFAVRELVRGPRGTEVRLKIEQSADGRVRFVLLRRDRVPQPTVPLATMLDDSTGYIEMSVGFSYTTVTEFDSALEALKAKGMSNLVLDLRGNSGGIVDQAVAIAEKFLPAGRKIVSQRGRRAFEDREWVSQNREPELQPIVLLTDGETASAAEIVAAAFQDNDRALVVGTRTFGKGLVQNVTELENGGGLTLTAARYYTPSGRSIQRDYSEIGLYDYFSRTNKSAASGHALQATRTITGRIVYGGDGIEPDIFIEPTEPDQQDNLLIDEIFHFSVEVVEGRIEGVGSRDDLRQSILFGGPVASDPVIEKFCRFAGISEPLDIGIRERIREQLSYFLSIGAFGVEAGQKYRLAYDPAVQKARSSIKDAKDLSDRAFSFKK